ncbi:hypothetical protein [Limnoglobus roseus]|uniref:Signal peptide prediction n=1 Tax=Limnoglobus roseus TaxID=2598579 RepID=A0A5C1AJI2_9BACT|nr:hypothetical protein PX52LOC_06074 [Limnoglobus roseus]
MLRLRRILGYLWASPNTLLGLLVLPMALATGGAVQVVRGVVEIHGGFARWFLARGLPTAIPIFGPAAALTLGHVVLGQDRECLDKSRDHEHVHVRQYERWGPFFLPAYFFASFLAWRRGQDPYFDNRFEREAYGTAS